jgi:hypothetical protein
MNISKNDTITICGVLFILIAPALISWAVDALANLIFN